MQDFGSNYTILILIWSNSTKLKLNKGSKSIPLKKKQESIILQRWIKENLVPTLTDKQKQYVYVNEADMLNMALFGITAKDWKDKDPDLDGNIRGYTNVLQLVILSNLEKLNAQMIEELENDIIEYIDYYNNKRIKRKLKGMSPVQYRVHSLATQYLIKTVQFFGFSTFFMLL